MTALRRRAIDSLALDVVFADGLRQTARRRARPRCLIGVARGVSDVGGGAADNEGSSGRYAGR